VSRLSNSTARHARHDERDWLDTVITTRSTHSTRPTCRVVSRRDVTDLEFGLYWQIDMASVMAVPYEHQMSWSESISLASTDPVTTCRRFRRSAGVTTGSVHRGRAELRRREGVRLGPTPIPSAFAESLLCHIGASVQRA